nr:MAG TPA: hypothetical protein [Caudoviricetes sp.]
MKKDNDIGMKIIIFIQLVVLLLQIINLFK